MKLPQKSELPIKTQTFEFLVDEAKLLEFKKAFREQGPHRPPTLMAISMKGIFDLLNQFEIDWKKLLHATQSFRYHSQPKIPFHVEARTSLVDLRFRASLYWLNFETEVFDKNSGKAVVSTKSLLMIREK